MCFVDRLRNCVLAGPINVDEEVELTFGRLNLGDIDVEKPDRLALELLPLWLFSLDVRQA